MELGQSTSIEHRVAGLFATEPAALADPASRRAAESLGPARYLSGRRHAGENLAGLLAKREKGLASSFANAYPYTSQTEETLTRLAALTPNTLAVMHGITLIGDGRRTLGDLAIVMR